MVRACIVPGCKYSDQFTLCHVFPRSSTIKMKWLESLQLEHLKSDDLNKFTVCCNHFRLKDYRHSHSNFLNKTAIPQLLIPDDERRKTTADEILVFPAPPQPPPEIPQTQEPITTSQGVLLEFEDETGEQIQFQTDASRQTLIPVVPKDTKPPEPKKLRLQKVFRKEKIANKDPTPTTESSPQKEPSATQSLTQDSNLASFSAEPQDVIITDEQKLRDYYTRFSKEELIEFLVRLKVLIE